MTDDELRRLADAATPGPWFQWTRAGDISSEPEDGCIASTLLTYVDDEGCTVATAQGNADCAFLAAARTAVPSLLDRLAVLRKALRYLDDFDIAADALAADDQVAKGGA